MARSGRAGRPLAGPSHPARRPPVRIRASTTRRSAHARVKRCTRSLKAASRGCCARTSSVRSTCSASGRGSTSSSFSNAAARSGSYLSAYRTIRRADSTTAIASSSVSFSGGRNSSPTTPQRPVLRPDRDADLLLERAQIAVDGPRRDAGPSRDLGWADAFGVPAQHSHDAQHPGEAVALAEALLALDARLLVETVVGAHDPGAWITRSRPRSVAVRKTSSRPWIASSSSPPASPFTDPASWPSDPSRKTQ